MSASRGVSGTASSPRVAVRRPRSKRIPSHSKTSPSPRSMRARRTCAPTRGTSEFTSIPGYRAGAWLDFACPGSSDLIVGLRDTAGEIVPGTPPQSRVLLRNRSTSTLRPLDDPDHAALDLEDERARLGQPG